MIINKQGIKIPAIFAYIKESSTEEAMNAFYPHELEDGARVIPASEHPDQRWFGLVLGEDETALLQRILDRAKSSADEELKDFAKRLDSLMGGALTSHEERLADAA